jgi:predicted kinase
MRLIFLHGGPATGKLTVAQALLRIVPGRLFDNHSAIDVARTVFEFGAPGFWELVHAVRVSVITAAAAQGIPVVVVTYCYAEPDDRPAFEEVDAIVQRHGGRLLPVYLSCSEEEAVRRVGNEDRAKRRKVTSAKGLREFLSRYRMSPVPRADCLSLDSAARSADATAQEIVRHFGLDAPEPAVSDVPLSIDRDARGSSD